MTGELQLLLVTAAGIGVLHTLLGPDHYLPFAAMAKARRWSPTKTVAVVAACGTGHVMGSVVLGVIGIAAGAALSELVALEALRGRLAAWLLIGFGLAYAGWGLRRALRVRPHTHRHIHVDGTVHEHRHTHEGGHLHVHDASPLAASVDGSRLEERSRQGGPTSWVLFIIFLFGPCEALVPVLMVPAARGSWWGVTWVCLVFGAATIGTMLVAVGLTLKGLARLDLEPFERYAHLAAGLTLAVCGVAIRMGM